MVDFFDYSVAGGDPEPAPATAAVGTFLESCSAREWRVLQQHSTIEVVKRGQVLVREGEQDQSLFIVLAGALAPRIAGVPDGARAQMVPGDVFGEVAFFDGRPRSSTVVAVEDSRIMRIRYEAFEALSAGEPVLARTLLLDLGRALAGRLRAAEAREAAR
ncbi:MULTISPECIES: Crp/Fnr family transcriptional regulator [unclassified Nocardioides]|uniref:Crp/Fnr family transcriptional regulator n=1 Tax=unclassified Nocardioides TaxID=2615069 RepID=UPI0006F9E639|nr:MULTISPECIES: cyclic nucleotide-binding domain-containing protein [unclassified Nocardioides]KRA38204.1 hypothetical protein ASD81_06010 [Nocardioides sp. Root614]KRA92164.1 hypothetical protein ASD84_06275 [Nocardioides sp. Root682]